MKKIALAEVEYIAFKTAKKFYEFDEPIPDFGTRFPNVLESSLAVPFQEFDRRAMYKGLIARTSILFYLMIKNHPFQNGNKRIAMTTMLVFLSKNNKWLKVDNKELYNFAVWVAGSPAGLKDEVIDGIKKFLKQNIISL